MKIFDKYTLKQSFLSAVIALVVSSCTSDPDSPGIEFMPDMYRPQSYEAYLEKYDVDSAAFFERNIDKIAPNFEELSDEDKASVLGEVSAIYAVWINGSATRRPVNGSVPVGQKPYPLSKEQKEESKQILNPVPFSKENLKEGKAFYELFCDHCHGAKGDGNGPMVQLGVYPAQPPSYTGAAKDLTAGEIYHTIYHGKGVMGSHASQISEDKRWKIVLYVESLQGKKGEEVGETAEGEKSDSITVSSTDSIK